MTLQIKTLLAISTCVTSTLICIYFISEMIVSESFQQMENSYAQDNTRRIVEVLNNELDHLSAISSVFAGRFQSWEQDNMKAIYPAKDLEKKALEELRINLVASFDQNGRLVNGLFVDPQGLANMEWPESWQLDLVEEHPLFIPRASSGQMRGIIRGPGGLPLLLGASRNASNLDVNGPGGTVVLGRFLDSTEIQRISKIAQMSLRLIEIGSLSTTDEKSNFYRSLIAGAPYQIYVHDNVTINGYAVLKDTRQRPLYLLETSFSRDIYNQGLATQDYFTKLLLIFGVLNILVTALLMNQLVLTRIMRLGRELSGIRESADISRLVTINGTDEFAYLATKFNQLLGGLQKARTELQAEIEERMNAETKLRRNQDLYKRAEAIVKLGHWEWDETEDKLVACSEQYAAIYGMTSKEIMLRLASRDAEINFVHADDRERVASAIKKSTERRTGLDIGYRLVMDDGTIKHVHRISEPVLTRSGKMIRTLGTLQDITRQIQEQERLKHYQKRLNTLMSELALAEEQERRRIANGLHDSTIQNLGLSKFKLSVLQNSLQEKDSKGLLNEVIGTINQAINDTRSLVFELSPPVLYELGFVPAVEWLAEQIHQQRGIVCEVYSDDLPKPLETPVMVMLFQIVRELLINVAKHAGASLATIQIDRIDDHIKIEIYDDGSGLVLDTLEDSAAGTQGFGLFSIRERLINIGEQLVIEASPGNGTRISFRAPLKIEGT